MAAICAKFCVDYDHYVKRRDIEYFREVGEILKPLSNHYWLKECGHFIEYDDKSIVQIPHDARSKISKHTESLRNGNERKFFLILDDYGGGYEPEFCDTDFAAKSVRSGCENVSHNYTGVCPTSVSVRWTWIQILTSLAARSWTFLGAVLVRSV